MEHQELASSSNLETKATMLPEQGLAAEEAVINNEEGIDPEKASDGAKAKLLFEEEPDAGMENGVLQMLLRAPRYFDPPEFGWPGCNEYGENDDEGNTDKPKRWHTRCYICGGSSHIGKRCKTVNACLICLKKGHLVIDCPEKNVKADSASTLCLKCGNTGHDMFSCTNEYNPEDLKVIGCYICKQVGHLCCDDKKAEGPREASCYTCGQSGHFGFECSIEVSKDLRPLCCRCKERGHSKRKCPKKKSAKNDGAETKAGKKKSRRARRGKNTEQTPNGNASNSQPNGVWWPPLVGPNYGRPPTGNASESQPPTGSASRSQPYGIWCQPVVGPYYARAPTGDASNGHLRGEWWRPTAGPYYRRPGSNVWLSPAAAARSNLVRQVAALPSQHIYHHQVGTQVLNSFDPLTGLPPEIGTQATQLPVNQETGIVLPQPGTQILGNLYHPAVPTGDYQRGTQFPQPHSNHQTETLLPQDRVSSSSKLPGPDSLI